MQNTFGFLIFDDVEELDFIGPWEIIKIWSEHFGGPEQVFSVSQNGGLIKCSRGLRVHADDDFAHCPPLNYLLVPGGVGRKREVNNPDLIEFIRTQAANAQYILSVCTGSFLLQKAGLLVDHKATTYWSALEELQQFDELKVVQERYVQDGKIWTAGGISSGIDLALALIAHVAGEEIAGKIQMYAEYFPLTKIYGDVLKTTHPLPTYLVKYLNSETAI